MINEKIEFNEYTNGLISGSHARIIINNNEGAPNLLRAFDIIFRYAFFNKSFQKYSLNEKTELSFEIVEAWLNGDEDKYNSLLNNKAAIEIAFPHNLKKGFYRVWMEREFNKSENEKYRELLRKGLVIYSNDDRFKRFDGVQSLKLSLGRSAIRKKELRGDGYVFFPKEIVDAVNKRCEESYKKESPALLAATLMLLGYYLVESKATNSRSIWFLQKDFQNWIGSKKFIDNYMTPLRETAIFDFTKDNVSKDKRIELIADDIDINLMEFVPSMKYRHSYIDEQGLYLVDSGSTSTFEELKNVLSSDYFASKK